MIDCDIIVIEKRKVQFPLPTRHYVILLSLKKELSHYQPDLQMAPHVSYLENIKNLKLSMLVRKNSFFFLRR
jgi:hypothetical protein